MRPTRGRFQGVESCITLFELGRLGLRGALPQGVAELFRKQIPEVCSVVWLGQESEALLDLAARLAHGPAALGAVGGHDPHGPAAPPADGACAAGHGEWGIDVRVHSLWLLVKI
jgi:hypothetical protein